MRDSKHRPRHYECQNWSSNRRLISHLPWGARCRLAPPSTTEHDRFPQNSAQLCDEKNPSRCAPPLFGLSQIPGRLQIHPQARGRAERRCKIEGRIRRYASLPANEFIQTSLGPPDSVRKCRLSYFPRLQKLLQKDDPRMKWIDRLCHISLCNRSLPHCLSNGSRVREHPPREPLAT